MNAWGAFYVGAVAGTLAHSVFPIGPLRGRQHTLGAEIIALSWTVAGAARLIFEDPTPLAAYAIIDVSTAAAFLAVALRKQAAWAAICVILHAGMASLHLAYFAIGQGNDNAYIWILNTLFLFALITVNTAIAAGRYAWGEGLDRWYHHRRRGWTFSGLRIPRSPYRRRAGA